MKQISFRRLLTAIYFFSMAAAAPGAWAQNPAPGNLIVLQAAASAANTTASFVEINPSLTAQTAPVQSIPISGTGADAIRISGSATSTAYLSRTNDGSLVTLMGVNSTNISANVNTLNPRAVVTLNASGSVAIATTYTGTSGNQTRSATSLNNTNWFIADQNGLYTNGSTSASPSGNLRGIKAFGGTVYVGLASTTSPLVSTVSAPSGGSITGLMGLPNGTTNFQDFYLIQSGDNGSTYDVLYTISATSATAGTIAKFSLVSGSWTANGTYTTTFGGFGLSAQDFGNGAKLYVTTGTGASVNNSVIQLTDAAGYNNNIGITTTNNLTLFTTATGTILKGIAFAPVAPCPTITATLTGTTTICTGSPASLTATVAGGTGPYSLTYSNGTTNTTVSSYVSGDAIAVTPTSSTTYTIVGLTDANGCTGTGSSTAVVTVNQPPTTADAGTSQTITSGSTATLAANTPTTGTASWSVTSGPSTSNTQFSSTTDPSATFTPAGGVGNYVLTWTISNAPCTPSSSNVTITVANPGVNLSVSSNTASEASPMAITVTATASAPVVGDQTVSLAVTGTGITTGDYTLSSTTITIPNGQTAGFVTFTVVDDNAVEGPETALLTISNPSAGIALGTTTTQNVVITDNDVAPGLSINDVTLNEGNAGTTAFGFTVSLSTPAPAGGVTFNITTADNTATAPSDYSTSSVNRATIPEGSSTYPFTVLVSSDKDYEPDETFFVNITNVIGATVLKGQGIGTILNDDAQPLPDLTVSLTDSPDPVVAGSALTYNFTVTNRGDASAATTTVSFPLPTGTTFTSFTAPAGWTPTTPAMGGTGTVTATNTSIAVNAPATFTLVVTPTVANPSLSATVSVSTTTPESNTLNNSATTTTTVNAANQPPVAPTFANQTGVVAVPFSYTVPAFTDPEGQALTYAITGVPAGLVADNTTRVISGTPTTTGVSTVTVVATDPQSASTAGTFTITINANQPPVASTVANQTATVGVAYSLTMPAFTDPENQTLTYVATGVPAPLTFNPTTRVISGTPSTTGVSTVTVTATDPASNTASVTFTLSVTATPAVGVIRITEFAYSGTDPGGEFIELTNVGNAPMDMTGWSFDDNSRMAGSFSIGSFGIVQPGESVIIAENSAADFKTAWFLPATVKVIGGNTENLGRSDELNVYDASNALIDRLTFGDNVSGVGGPRTNGASAWTTRPNLGTNTITNWQLSVTGDAQRSYVSTTGNIGNPGGYYIPLNRVLVRESGGSTLVTEGGNTDTYTVTLNSQPTSDVTITITPGSQLTLNTTTLTFTPTNYSTVQTVTVTAVDDAIYQGEPRSVTITQAATSSDVAYNGITVNPVSVTIIDNDVAANAPPTIQVANTTTPYLNLPANTPAYVSGVAGDATDPATTLGVNFTLTDADTDVNSLTVTASSNNGNATLNLTGSGSTRNLKITPGGVGYATITVTVTDGSNAVNYVINYAASAASTSTSHFHTGRSDASTAQDAGNGYMFVGDDESNVLRLYNRTQSGLPVYTFDAGPLLNLTDMSGGVPREVDIEASAKNGSRIYWFGSQSNSESGNFRPNRNRVFTTDVTGSGASATLTYVGRYDYLRDDLLAWDANNGHGKGANYYGFTASAADGVNSKMNSGYNIEGAEFAPDNATLYVGFRAPQVPLPGRTKALIVPVTNLTTLAVSGGAQGSATFGAPIELDLGGRGIREIRKNAANQYLIVAGAAGSFGAAPNDFRLYTWTGNPADAPVLRTGDLSALGSDASSIESIVELPVTLDANSSIQFLLDNGDMVYYNDGIIAKDLTQNNFKKSRSDYATVGAPVNTPPTVANAVSPQSATVGTAYTLNLSNVFTDAETPNSLTLSVSTLPAGLSFTAPSTISGTPSMSGVSSVTVTATDPGSLTASNTFTITVQPAPVVVTPLALTFTASPNMILTSGTTTLSATVSGGTTPYSYTFTGSSGTITPTGNTATVSNLMAGLQTFTVVARDATTPTSQTISGTVSVTVTQANTPPTVANAVSPQSATVGVAYALSLANVFTDAETPNSLTLSVSTLPAGLSFTAPATISGTPSMSGVSSVTVTATDPGSLTASNTFTITVQPAPVVVTPLALTFTASPNMILTSGTTTLSATVSGGTTPYSYTFTGSSGTITPTGNTATVSNLMAGLQTFTVVARDATTPTSQTISGTVSVTVNQATPPPTAPFSITGVTTVSCQTISAGQRRVTFNPRYAGLNGTPVSFSVVNELVATTNPGPYTLNLYTDNSVITLSATQSGANTQFAYNWLTACGSSTANTPQRSLTP